LGSITAECKTFSCSNKAVYANDCRIFGDNNVVYGDRNYCTGNNCRIFGNDNAVQGTGNTVVGMYNSQKGTNNIIEARNVTPTPSPTNPRHLTSSSVAPRGVKILEGSTAEITHIRHCGKEFVRINSITGGVVCTKQRGRTYRIGTTSSIEISERMVVSDEVMRDIIGVLATNQFTVRDNAVYNARGELLYNHTAKTGSLVGVPDPEANFVTDTRTLTEEIGRMVDEVWRPLSDAPESPVTPPSQIRRSLINSPPDSHARMVARHLAAAFDAIDFDAIQPLTPSANSPAFVDLAPPPPQILSGAKIVKPEHLARDCATEHEDEEDCTICNANRPQFMLQCHHQDFCASCLSRIEDAHEMGGIPCPICRELSPTIAFTYRKPAIKMEALTRLRSEQAQRTE
jgi:hypothetical protein